MQTATPGMSSGVMSGDPFPSHQGNKQLPRGLQSVSVPPFIPPTFRVEKRLFGLSPVTSSLTVLGYLLPAHAVHRPRTTGGGTVGPRDGVEHALMTDSILEAGLVSPSNRTTASWESSHWFAVLRSCVDVYAANL